MSMTCVTARVRALYRLIVDRVCFPSSSHDNITLVVVLRTRIDDRGTGAVRKEKEQRDDRRCCHCNNSYTCLRSITNKVSSSSDTHWSGKSLFPQHHCCHLSGWCYILLDPQLIAVTLDSQRMVSDQWAPHTPADVLRGVRGKKSTLTVQLFGSSYLMITCSPAGDSVSAWTLKWGEKQFHFNRI